MLNMIILQYYAYGVFVKMPLTYLSGLIRIDTYVMNTNLSIYRCILYQRALIWSLKEFKSREWIRTKVLLVVYQISKRKVLSRKTLHAMSFKNSFDDR